MSKFTFICEADDGAVFTATQERDDLDIVLEDFQNFLRGCGYYFDGNVAIISEDGSQVNWPYGTVTTNTGENLTPTNWATTPQGYVLPANPFNFSKDLPNRNPKE